MCQAAPQPAVTWPRKLMTQVWLIHDPLTKYLNIIIKLH